MIFAVFDVSVIARCCKQVYKLMFCTFINCISEGIIWQKSVIYSHPIHSIRHESATALRK